MQATQSQDVMESRAHALLTEWGEYQRKERSPLRQIGNPIAQLMANQGRRSRDDKRRRWAFQRSARLVEVQDPDGSVRKVRAFSMVPERVDKQTDVSVEAKVPWPEMVSRVDRVLAKLPVPLLDALRVYYIAGHSIRSGAEVLRVDRNEFQRRLDRGRWYLAGRFEEIDM